MDHIVQKVTDTVKNLSPKRPRPVVAKDEHSNYTSCCELYHSISLLSCTWLDKVNEDFSEQRLELTESSPGHSSFTLNREPWYYEDVGDEFLKQYREEGYVRWALRLHEVSPKSAPGPWTLGSGERLLVIPIQQTGLIEFKWDVRPQLKAYTFKNDKAEHRERENGSRDRSARSLIYTLHET
jgi:hypothetical protein